MKKLIGKTKRQALVEIEKAFVKHGILEVECNGSLTPCDIRLYLEKKAYDFGSDIISSGYVIRLTSNVDLPYIYAETL